MQNDLPNHSQSQDDPEGHVGPKTAPSSSPIKPEGHVGPKLDPEGHVGPKTTSGSSQIKPEGHVGPKLDPEGHVGPKITPNSPISLDPIPAGTSSTFTLTITNLNNSVQDWTWHGNTPTNPVTVNTAPITLQPGAQQTLTATVNSTGLTQGNNYSSNLTFTFTQVNLSTTITVQFSVS